jgi:uncharacterized protein YndB with AHSA1/START domain
MHVRARRRPALVEDGRPCYHFNMKQDFVAHVSVVIQARPAKVWDALTDPAQIKLYLFDTQAESDWRVGSPVRYRGVWQGRAYEDKGRVVDNVPLKRLTTTYWSSLSGLPDVPENYATVKYELEPAEGGTRLTVTQDNNPSPESRDHSERNWTLVLEGLKKLVEGGRAV